MTSFTHPSKENGDVRASIDSPRLLWNGIGYLVWVKFRITVPVFTIILIEKMTPLSLGVTVY